MRKLRFPASIIAALAGVLLFAIGPHAAAAAEPGSLVKGTGGSSSVRVLAQWNFLFTKETGIGVEYAAANSGVGIRSGARETAYRC